MSGKFKSVNFDSDFISRYITGVEGEIIRVYLCAKSIEEPSVLKLSEELSLPMPIVHSAISFWQKEGRLYEENGKISFPKIETKKVRFDQRPEYDPMELRMYAEKNHDVRELFDITQGHLGRLLTHNDLSGIFSIYTWLGLPIPVISRLLEFCTEKGHRNMRYIERVAIDWAENEIMTPDDAEEKIKIYNVDFRKIMRAMGQSGRNPIAREEKYMTLWIKELKMPIELIENACEKAVFNTGKSSFGYANRILAEWAENGVKNLEEARALEDKYIQEKQKKKEEKKPTTKKNGFINFEQRNYDYEEYERMEFERISGGRGTYDGK